MHCLRCYFQAELCYDANCVVSSYNTLKATCLSMTPKESRLVFVSILIMDTFMCISCCSESGHFFLNHMPGYEIRNHYKAV